ncbi:MAG: DUF1080 domain-containing protein [Luteitalea sp.]|nr:DUF1080 domain-containing protein [Luteitalea sp.]
MKNVNRLVGLWLLILAMAVGSWGVPVARATADPNEAIRPSETIRLFNGKDLTSFYTWLVDHKHEDPDEVFSVVDRIDGGPAIRISGEHWGGIVTKEEYRDYHLVVEYRWGLATWGKRQDRTKDAGILLHGQGPDGNSTEDFNGPWMRSVEFQIIQGGTGDIILVRGHTENGELVAPRLTATVGDGPKWDPDGTPREFEGGRIDWYGRDPEWNDVLGFRGREDVEHPDGQWNRLEAFAENDSFVYMVNGVIVNKGTRSSLTAGKILVQSEGAEIYFRRIELRPLPPQ